MAIFFRLNVLILVSIFSNILEVLVKTIFRHSTNVLCFAGSGRKKENNTKGTHHLVVNKVICVKNTLQRLKLYVGNILKAS